MANMAEKRTAVGYAKNATSGKFAIVTDSASDTTKEIAQLRGIAVATVSRHREHIREKLNLKNKNINLVTYLNSF